MVFFSEASWLTTKLADQTKDAIEKLRSGKNAKEIAKEIYMSAGHKNEESAADAVERINNTIEGYFRELLDEEKDEEWVEKKLDAMVSYIRSPAERCKIYYRALVLLGAYSIYYSKDGASVEEAEAFIYERGEYSSSENDAETDEQILREELKETLLQMNCPIYPTSSLLDQISASDDDLSLPAVVAEFGRKSADVKLIMATQALVNYYNGEYKGKEIPLSPEAIIYAVCAGIDYNALEKEPSLAKKILVKLADMLICILLVTLFAATALILFHSLTVMFGIVWGIAAFIFCLIAFWISETEDGYDDSLLVKVGLSLDQLIKDVLRLPYALYDGAKKGIVFLAKKISDFFSGFGGGNGALSVHAAESVKDKETEKKRYVEQIKTC